tara:strand:- start:1189 stop:1401 length:213 start_codon:yes stop_codon:yes gene_type:complete
MSEQGIRTPFGIIPMDEVMDMIEPLIERDKEIKRLRNLLINTFYDGVDSIREQNEKMYRELIKEFKELIE